MFASTGLPTFVQAWCVYVLFYGSLYSLIEKQSKVSHGSLYGKWSLSIVKHKQGEKSFRRSKQKTFTTFGQTKINNKQLENKININTNKLIQT